MSDIFISYARKDRAQAKVLADAFERRGWSVWWDPHIRAGESFDRVIETALSKAKCVVVMWSKHSVTSDWVRAEAANGLERNVLISVVVEENVTLPLRFSHVHTETLADWRGDDTTPAFEKVIGDMTILLGAPPDSVKKAAMHEAVVQAEGNSQIPSSDALGRKRWHVKMIQKTETKKTFLILLTHERHTIEYEFNGWIPFKSHSVKVNGEVVASGGHPFTTRLKLDFYLTDGNERYNAMTEAFTFSSDLEKVLLSIGGRMIYESEGRSSLDD